MRLLQFDMILLFPISDGVLVHDNMCTDVPGAVWPPLIRPIHRHRKILELVPVDNDDAALDASRHVDRVAVSLKLRRRALRGAPHGR